MLGLFQQKIVGRCRDRLCPCSEAGNEMLDKSHERAAAEGDRRPAGDLFVTSVFIGVAGFVMTAWIAAIGWVSRQLVAWLFS